MPTLRDVALRAGVSKAAASYVLSGRKTPLRIPTETQERIRAAARELGYHPNALARALVTKRTRTVALVRQHAEHLGVWQGFNDELIRSATQACLRADLDLMLRTRQASEPEAEAASLADGRCDGALVFRHLGDPLPDLLLQRNFPFVQLFSRHPNPNVPWVACDNTAGGRRATEYLLELGHRQILHLSAGSAHSSAVIERAAGYREAMSSRGLEPAIIPSGWEWASDEEWAPVVQALKSTDRPTAVFAWYDGLALRVLRTARALGLRVPEDLSIIGFDSSVMCAQVDPPLTSVRQPVDEIVGTAVERLVAQINGEPLGDLHRVIPPALDVRGSCGPRSQAEPVGQSPARNHGGE
jgi:LacI family transcriptional regulator